MAVHSQLPRSVARERHEGLLLQRSHGGIRQGKRSSPADVGQRHAVPEVLFAGRSKRPKLSVRERQPLLVARGAALRPVPGNASIVKEVASQLGFDGREWIVRRRWGRKNSRRQRDRGSNDREEVLLVPRCRCTRGQQQGHEQEKNGGLAFDSLLFFLSLCASVHLSASVVTVPLANRMDARPQCHVPPVALPLCAANSERWESHLANSSIFPGATPPASLRRATTHRCMPSPRPYAPTFS